MTGEPEMTDKELDTELSIFNDELLSAIDAYLARTGGVEARLRQLYERLGLDEHRRLPGEADQSRPAASSAETKIQP